ncbi:hypothetical protein ACFQHO_52740 [Actinomadura yumaensis]|uniref:hypothetical protein n=1 Tax=Actinomadura yumaensis TaxID=111807 RepID=UPI00361A7D1C
MSHPKKHLRTLQGIVEAPVEQVTPLVLDVPPVEGVTVDADPAARTVAVQGGWWYRSETTVTPVPEGSLITQKIYNVAQRLRWGSPSCPGPRCAMPRPPSPANWKPSARASAFLSAPCATPDPAASGSPPR